MSGVEWIWGLRTVAADGSSHCGFVWPRKGRASAPAWDPGPRRGGGLHFLAWGAGASHLLNWGDSALWQVVRAPADEVVDFDDRVKAHWVDVVYTGRRRVATSMLALHCPAGSGPIHGAVVVVGHHATAHAGDRGHATAGDHGTATVGDRGTAVAGYHGTAYAGYGGVATVGEKGTATADGDGRATAGIGGRAIVDAYGIARAGYAGTAVAGVRGTAVAGVRGTAAAGEDGTAAAGAGGTLILSYGTLRRVRPAAARVGESAPGLAEGEVIEADTPYRVVVVDDLPRWEVAS